MYPSTILTVDRGVYADPHDVGQLVEPLRSRIYTAIRDAPTGGLVLVSGRRSPWQQYLLRVERVGASHAFDSRYAGSPRTALPYRSNHQRGTAADMGGRELDWLLARLPTYGLGRTVPGERWHLEAVGVPHGRIIPYGSTPTPHTEEFTVDAEAKAAFKALQSDVSTIKGGLLKMAARIEELEKDRFKPTTSRVRVILEHMGIKDPA